jgi:hypothetical protein
MFICITPEDTDECSYHEVTSLETVDADTVRIHDGEFIHTDVAVAEYIITVMHPDNVPKGVLEPIYPS